jgi:hypothetical protein
VQASKRPINKRHRKQYLFLETKVMTTLLITDRVKGGLMIKYNLIGINYMH